MKIPIIFKSPPTLENDVIQLVPMENKHSISLYQINHSNHWHYMLSAIQTQQEMDTWVTHAIQLREKGLALPFTIINKKNNQIVGTTRLYEINSTQRTCELGSTWYGKDYQRTFVNSTCKLLLLTFCFETLNFIRVQFKTDERNERSQKAIERIGAIKEGVIRNERILSNGYIRNAVLYSITKEEWIDVKQGFIEREEKYRLRTP
ncbi:GNAT family N-acetyltransferase [Fictibacillus phosphorivorans]|uniref:GNAT family N-acetyltransferase n=1 Tax=Fictibacillus phosphorivorans TaxID=1221500 RepID=UPI0012940E83|nr:GNAT family protein [Fictibacillus phosphorivorans]MQR97198.1 N-acetyltransferase [Fictibacillus phosphorivorans]